MPKRDISEPVVRPRPGRRARDRASGQPGVRARRPHRAAARAAAAAAAAAARRATPARARTTSSSTSRKEEFMQVFFDDLALPHLIRTQLAETPELKSQRAGFTSDGTPSNLHVVRSMRGAIGRRIAIGAGSRRELRELEAAARRAARASATPPRSWPRRRARAADRRAARAARPHPLPRPDRPALPQPRARAGADRQGGDVLPDGRLGLDGRGAQGPVQALLHPAVPVPDAALREDRHRLHPPPHAGAGSRRGELLPRHARPAAPWSRARSC